ncbi:MAG: hypothetical protein MOP51_3109, partial [Citricoccus sp.]|nr:hypothetical protein [Citricoccus sp. WCRC_4]
MSELSIPAVTPAPFTGYPGRGTTPELTTAGPVTDPAAHAGGVGADR